MAPRREEAERKALRRMVLETSEGSEGTRRVPAHRHGPESCGTNRAVLGASHLRCAVNRLKQMKNNCAELMSTLLILTDSQNCPFFPPSPSSANSFLNRQYLCESC